MLQIKKITQRFIFGIAKKNGQKLEEIVEDQKFIEVKMKEINKKLNGG